MINFSAFNSYGFSDLSVYAGEIRLILEHLFQRYLMNQTWSQFDLQIIAILSRIPETAKLRGTIE